MVATVCCSAACSLILSDLFQTSKRSEKISCQVCCYMLLVLIFHLIPIIYNQQEKLRPCAALFSNILWLHQMGLISPLFCFGGPVCLRDSDGSGQWDYLCRKTAGLFSDLCKVSSSSQRSCVCSVVLGCYELK